MLANGQNPARPFPFREGETDRFYFVYAEALAEGDILTGSPLVTSDGLTISGALINSQPLNLGGVIYAEGTVVEFTAANIKQGDKAEAVCQVTTQAGRVLIDSMWLRGVNTYAGSI